MESPEVLQTPRDTTVMSSKLVKSACTSPDNLELEEALHHRSPRKVNWRKTAVFPPVCHSPAKTAVAQISPLTVFKTGQNHIKCASDKPITLKVVSSESFV